MSADLKLTDTDRMNALFTMFGGWYLFEIGFRVQDVLRDGRRGFDAFLAKNPSLLPAEKQPSKEVKQP